MSRDASCDRLVVVSTCITFHDCHDLSSIGYQPRHIDDSDAPTSSYAREWHDSPDYTDAFIRSYKHLAAYKLSFVCGSRDCLLSGVHP